MTSRGGVAVSTEAGTSEHVLRSFAFALCLVVGCQAPAPDRTHPPPASSPPIGFSVAAVTPTLAIPPANDPPGTYMGRPIAPTMSHEGADWLVRPEREKEENAARMLEELKLTPGDVACDIGAGNGYHTLTMARMVAPKGRAIAVDIQPEMLSLLQSRAKEQGILNIETVLGTTSDPKLPRGACDRILLADVYHELDDPAGMLAHLATALSAKGELVLVEFRLEDSNVPIMKVHKMERAQVIRELEANGYTLSREYKDLPWQHMLFFERRRARDVENRHD